MEPHQLKFKDENYSAVVDEVREKLIPVFTEHLGHELVGRGPHESYLHIGITESNVKFDDITVEIENAASFMVDLVGDIPRFTAIAHTMKPGFHQSVVRGGEQNPDEEVFTMVDIHATTPTMTFSVEYLRANITFTYHDETETHYVYTPINKNLVEEIYVSDVKQESERLADDLFGTLSIDAECDLYTSTRNEVIDAELEQDAIEDAVYSTFETVDDDIIEYLTAILKAEYTGEHVVTNLDNVFVEIPKVFFG